MNRQISKLFMLTALLFGLLVFFTSHWTVFEAQSLKGLTANRRPLIEEQRVPRGLILARDGTVLARSVGRGRGQSRIFTRTYPNGRLFSHAVGYSFIENGRRGLEQSRNDALAGKRDEFETIFSQIESRKREGFDVHTNLDPDAQREAASALAGQAGSVVAIEPQTGRVRTMVSIPEYDPNRIGSDFRELNLDRRRPLINRATQDSYPPGSTFKVVTAAAALDSGKFTPDSIVDGSSPKTISATPLSNFGGQDFGPITLTDALTNSVNTVWASVGERIGRKTLLEYMDRFGFNQDPKLDYPDDQMRPSGIRGSKDELLDSNAGFDTGRVAIGQGGAEGAIRVTPLQMAMVAATVANGGRLMKPRLTDRIVGKDGRVRQRIEPDLQSRVMSGKAADQLTEMMGNVVEEGSGTAGALEGIRVAGKTGTAEVGADRESNQAWFIAFAPIERPKMAIAVTVERTQGQGGTVAAPIAKRVLQVLLRKR